MQLFGPVRRAVMVGSCVLIAAAAEAAVATAAPKQSTSATIEIIRVIPSIIWPVFLGALLFWKRREVGRLFGTLSRRVEAGAPLKLTGVIEVGSGKGLAKTTLVGRGTFDRDPSRDVDRHAVYQACQFLMLVHTLHPSSEDGQIYDVLLYLIPKEGSGDRTGSLLNVAEVQYYFGKHWDHLVVTSKTRLNGFAVKVSAYGPFLCVARVILNDGTELKQYRYVDFESPALHPLVMQEQEGN